MKNKNVNKEPVNAGTANGRGVNSTDWLGFFYAFVCGVFFIWLISDNRFYPWYIEIILMIVSIHLYIITRPKGILR